MSSSSADDGVSLRVDGLALRAGGSTSGRSLFERLSFQVQAGERWVVVGPNGAGKSSLLAAIAGVFPIAVGRVEIDGRPLGDGSSRVLASRRAWSPQFWSDPFPSTVRETAAMARSRGLAWAPDGDAHDAAVDAVLQRLSLMALGEADVRTLSGGERQRVAIATALLQEAPLLLLDEPASHLDLAHQRMLVEVLADHVHAGGSVVASVHDLNLAWDLSDHAVLIDGRGSAVAGTRDDVLTATRLSDTFGVSLERIEHRGTARFVVSGQGS